MEKYLSLFVGILVTFMAGVVYSFNVYAVALKSTFNFTQTEVEYIASSGDMGQSFYLPAGLIFDKFGSRTACIIGLILTGAGYGLFWMTTKFRTFFGANAWLVAVIYLVTMFGTTFPYIASYGVNCKNIGKKHQGKVLWVLDNTYGIAPTIYSAIYQGFFVQGHIKDAENQKFGDFMLFLTIMSVIINLLAVALQKVVVPEAVYQDETEMNELFKTLEQENDRDETALVPKPGSNDDTNVYQQPDLDAWQIIKTLEFYYIFLVLLIVGGTGAAFINNISLVLKSVHREYDTAVFTICLPIFGAVGRIITVLTFNYIFQNLQQVPKSISLLPITMFTCIGTIVISFNQGFVGLFSSMIMISAAYAGLYIQLKWILIELFGLKYFGQNYGIVMIGHVIGMLGFQLLFGFSYEVNSLPGSRQCFGESCSKGSFVLFTILCFCALFVNICLVKIERDTKVMQRQNNDW